MELPAALRSAVDRMLDGVPLESITKAGARLSDRYRREVRDGRLHIDDGLAAKAYLATRLPATFAAVRAAMEMVAEAAPGFSPSSLIDAGSGPGTVLWAAADCWPDLRSAKMVEASDSIRSVGETLSSHAGIDATWLKGDVTLSLPSLTPADLVTLSYVLDEVPAPSIGPIIEKLWALTAHTLIIIEPGTTAGWQRILAARTLLVNAGAHLIAPCPHAQDCPIAVPDWCHFSRRVARSRIHRLAKNADVPWEDEKYIFIAASRFPAEPPTARVLAPPKSSSGVARLKLCLSDGSADEVTLSRRDGEAFKQARRADWGDGLDLPARGNRHDP